MRPSARRSRRAMLVVITAGPHSGAGKSLKLNLAPYGPFRAPACAPPSLFATAPPGLSGARGTVTRPKGGRRTRVSSRGAGRGQGGDGARAGDARRLTRADRALGRGRRTALDSQASGATLTDQDGAAGPAGGNLGRGERAPID